ncbi:MAG: hypothetical protein JJT89_02080 [Nitriliruptoraceae bacterium]|nr:hypothetical protein [Nitriliruptoraceae bacterium]
MGRSGPRPGIARRAGAQDGFVAGLEALAFGVLVFVLGTLLVVNAWAIVDAKFATNTAAREAVRSVVEAAASELGEGDILARARQQAENAAATHGFAPEDVTVRTGGVGLCRGDDVSIEVEVTIASLLAPGAGGWGDRRVASVHTEQLDPFRSGLSC